MPFRDFRAILMGDTSADRILVLENWIQYIKERIKYAESLTTGSIKYADDGTNITKELWIKQANEEKAKLEKELALLR